jgi:hypothetical protein
MTAEAGQWGVPIPAGQVDYLIATAARAPSVHNTSRGGSGPASM